MKAVVTEKGIFIPKELLKGMKAVIIIRKENEIVIKPEPTLTRQLQGHVKSVISSEESIRSYQEDILEEIFGETE